MHIGILEDDASQLALLQLWLQAGQHTYSGYETRAKFVAALESAHFDLLIVDWMLPDGSGADVLHHVRHTMASGLPIVILTSRDDEATVVRALHAGADDYVVKPAKPMELLARLEAVSRRSRQSSPKVFRMGGFEFDMLGHKLAVQGQVQVTTQKEFALAAYFFQNEGKLFSREHLLHKVWGIQADVDTRTVDTHVSRLRKKLQLDGSGGYKLSPVYGYGYRFDRVNA
jgi:two-component system response regulator RegX3